MKKTFWDNFKDKYIYQLAVTCTIAMFGLLIRVLIVLDSVSEMKSDLKDIKIIQSNQAKEYVLKADYDKNCEFNNSVHNNLQMQISQRNYEVQLHGNNITER